MPDSAPTLILDGNQRSALAATRSLGRQGIPIVVADCSERSLAAASRFCSAAAMYPDPTSSADAALNKILDIISKHSIETVMPMTDVSTHLLLQNRAKLDDLRIPCPSLHDYNFASNKAEIAQMASNLGIPVPEGEHYVPDVANSSLQSNISFPRVIKPCRSKVPTADGYHSTTVRIVNSQSEHINLLESDESVQMDGFLVQQYVPGHGAGVFALYDHGREVALFAHRRIREKPPTGGVSVLSESTSVNAELAELSRSLLASLNWNGPAMIEYRVADDGTPYLMEINARFWGSLQLAVSAGVDFPYLAWQVANDLRPSSVLSYSDGIRNRWLLGDFDSLYLYLRDPSNSVGQKLRRVAAFLNFFDRSSKLEVLRFNDFRPFRFEVREYFRNLRK